MSASLRVAANDDGEFELEAHEATLADTLRALATHGNFEVVIDDSIARPPVTLSMSQASLARVLRRVLHGRNYAVYWDEGTVERVIVLPPTVVPSSRSVRKPGARRVGR